VRQLGIRSTAMGWLNRWLRKLEARRTCTANLTASGLVEGVDAIEHATLDDPSLDRRAPGSCQSTLARSSISSMTTEVAPAVGYA